MASQNLTENDLNIIKTDWSEVSIPFEISIWVLIVAILELIINSIRKFKYFAIIPETCYLIILGMIIGSILEAVFDQGNLVEIINEDVFFLVLLPPIVFDAGYNMPRLAFLENLGSILCFAIANTLFNAVFIGGSMYLVYEWGWCEEIFSQINGLPMVLNITVCLLFGSIISAVDPVAVIAVFDEIHVNAMLFICVFGESLLNDGVAVVLYQAFADLLTHSPESLDWSEVAFLIEEFLYVAFGGVIIGALIAILVSLVTKYWPQDNKSLSLFEPVVVYLFPYISYLLGEYLGMSAILAVVTCGYIMKPHVEENITQESKHTVHALIHFTSHVGEVSIFIWLGLVTIQTDWSSYFNWSLCLWVLCFISIYRFIGIYVFGWLLNFGREDIMKFTWQDLLISSFGGLRGGIAFSLTQLSPIIEDEIKQTLICIAIFIILFTSFIQGILVKPLVKGLGTKLEVPIQENLFTKFSQLSAKNTLKCLQAINGIRSRVTDVSLLNDWCEVKFWPILRRNNEKMMSGSDRYGIIQLYLESIKEVALEVVVDKTDLEVTDTCRTIERCSTKASQKSLALSEIELSF